MKKLNWCLAILILLAIAVNAAEWDSYGKDNRNTFRVGDATGNWDDSAGTPTTSGESPDYQPTAMNISGSANMEIVFPDGNFIKIMDSTGNLLDELNFGYAITSPVTLYDNGTRTNMLFINNSHFHSYNYNGTFTNVCSAPVERDQHSPNSSTAFQRNIKCSIDDTNGCYFLNDFGNVCEVNALTCGMTCYTVRNQSSNGNFRATMGTLTGSPNEMFITKFDSNSIMVFDTDAAGLFTSFDTDGIWNLATAGIYNMSNPMIYNVNGAGDSEILFNYVEANAGTTTGDIYILRSDGSHYASSPYEYHTIANTGGLSTALDLAIVVQPSFHVCTAGYSNVFQNVSCLDLAGTQYNIDYTYLNVSALGTPTRVSNIFTADMTGDGLDEVILPSGIFELDGTLLYAIGNEQDTNIIGEDFAVNGDIQIFKYDTTNSYMYTSTFVNAPPTLNNSLRRGGYGSNLGFDSPICLNSTVTFSAQECGGAITACNYINDGANDDELISTNCGQLASGLPASDFTTNKVDGTLAGAAPIYQCIYNNTGTYNVRLYLEDDANAGDLTQFNTETIIMNVIEGVPGLTCNLGGGAEVGAEEPVTGDTAIDDSVEATLGIFFGTSPTLKLIVAMGLFIGIMAAVASQTKNGFVLASSGMATLVMLTFLSLIPAYIMILLLVGMIMLIIVGKFMLSGSPSSE